MELQRLVDKVWELGSIIYRLVPRVDKHDEEIGKLKGLYDRVSRLESDVESLKSAEAERERSANADAQTEKMIEPSHRQARIGVLALILGFVSLATTIVLTIAFHR